MRYRRVSYRFVEQTGMRPRGDPWFARQPLGLTRPHWRPACDLFETREAFTLRAELAGLDDEDCRVTLYEDAVVVEGERPWDPEPEARYLAAEIARGSFRLEVPLPSPVAREEVSARIERGLLTVILPKGGFARS